MKYSVYIIYSASLDRFYVGYTGGDMNIRLKKHNANHKGFTGGNADWVIKYVEEFETKTGAMKREMEIKRWKSRLKIEQLFAN
jgi:putative endonuclease